MINIKEETMGRYINDHIALIQLPFLQEKSP